jgi:hypothetical protein
MARTSDDFCQAICIFPNGTTRKSGVAKAKLADIRTAQTRLIAGTKATVTIEDAPTVLTWLTQKATTENATSPTV